MGSVSSQVSSDLELFFSSLTDIQRRVLDYLFWADAHHLKVWVSQTRIATHVGITREHVNRILYHFEALGIIRSAYRHLKTSLYTVSNFFCDPKIRTRLCHLFAALSFMPWHMYVDKGTHWQKRDQVQQITQYKSKYYLDIISLSKDRFSRLATRLTPFINYIRPFIPHQFTKPSSSNRKNSIQQVISDSKEEMLMQESPIRQSIRDLRTLNLSRWGQIELMQFPDEAIAYAQRSMKSANPREPFKYFMKLCYGYCNDNGIRPSVSTTTGLLQQFKRPEKFSMTIEPLSGKEFAHGFSISGFSAYSTSSSAKRQSSATIQESPQRKEWAGHSQGTALSCTEHQQCLENKQKKSTGWRTMTPYQRQLYIKSLNKTLLNQLITMSPQDKLAEITEAYAAQPDQAIDSL